MILSLLALALQIWNIAIAIRNNNFHSAIGWFLAAFFQIVLIGQL